jgi:hypothetical protein
MVAVVVMAAEEAMAAASAWVRAREVALASEPVLARVAAPEQARGLAKARVELDPEPPVAEAVVAAELPLERSCKSVRKCPLHRHADRRRWAQSKAQLFRLHFPTGPMSTRSTPLDSSPSSCSRLTY